MHLNGKGYKATLEGENKGDATSGEADVRAAYARKNGDLFREILRMFNAKCTALHNPARYDDGPEGTAVRLQGRAWRAGEAAP